MPWCTRWSCPTLRPRPCTRRATLPWAALWRLPAAFPLPKCRTCMTWPRCCPPPTVLCRTYPLGAGCTCRATPRAKSSCFVPPTARCSGPDAFATTHHDSLPAVLLGLPKISRAGTIFHYDWAAARQSVQALAALNPRRHRLRSRARPHRRQRGRTLTPRARPPAPLGGSAGRICTGWLSRRAAAPAAPGHPGAEQACIFTVVSDIFYCNFLA